MRSELHLLSSAVLAKQNAFCIERYYCITWAVELAPNCFIRLLLLISATRDWYCNGFLS